MSGAWNLIASSPWFECDTDAMIGCMSTPEHSTDGPISKPSQAEGEDPDRTEDHTPLPADGHPSQAEGEDTEASA